MNIIRPMNTCLGHELSTQHNRAPPLPTQPIGSVLGASNARDSNLAVSSGFSQDHGLA